MVKSELPSFDASPLEWFLQQLELFSQPAMAEKPLEDTRPQYLGTKPDHNAALLAAFHGMMKLGDDSYQQRIDGFIKKIKVDHPLILYDSQRFAKER